MKQIDDLDNEDAGDVVDATASLTPPTADRRRRRHDRVRSGRVSTFKAASLAELATPLIKARIARGLTQRQLADLLGVAEQQIQRYEATEYRSASLERICDVTDALDVTITERLSLRGPDAA